MTYSSLIPGEPLPERIVDIGFARADGRPVQPGDDIVLGDVIARVMSREYEDVNGCEQPVLIVKWRPNRERNQGNAPAGPGAKRTP